MSVGFGSKCLEKIQKIAEKLDLKIIDLVENVVDKIRERKEKVKQKLNAVKGFQKPDLEELEDQKNNDLFKIEDLEESEMEKDKEKEIQKDKEFMEVVEIVEKEDEDIREEEEDDLFEEGKDEDELGLDREDMEVSPEALEKEIVKEVLAQNKKSIVVLRSYLRKDERRMLSRELEEILESIECVPDHLMIVYVDKFKAIENLFDGKLLKKMIVENKEKQEMKKQKKLEIALENAKKDNSIKNMDTEVYKEKNEENEKLENKTIEEELEELGLDVNEVIGETNEVLSFKVAKKRLRQNIIQRIEDEFERYVTFTERLLEKQSLVVPLKMTREEFHKKNSVYILEKLRKILNNQIKSVEVNGITLVVSEEEGETARQKVLRQLKEKKLSLSDSGLRNLFNKHVKLKSEDFPVVYDQKVHFLKGIQDFWKLMKNPSVLDCEMKSIHEEKLKVFVGGFDQDEKRRVCKYLEEEFGLVRLNKQRVIQDVLFGVQYSQLLGLKKEDEKEEDENENEEDNVEQTEEGEEEESPEVKKRRLVEELRNSRFWNKINFKKNWIKLQTKQEVKFPKKLIILLNWLGNLEMTFRKCGIMIVLILLITSTFILSRIT
jgi:hypothetical protein